MEVRYLHYDLSSHGTSKSGGLARTEQTETKNNRCHAAKDKQISK